MSMMYMVSSESHGLSGDAVVISEGSSQLLQPAARLHSYMCMQQTVALSRTPLSPAISLMP